jgi:hypothetical protein
MGVKILVYEPTTEIVVICPFQSVPELLLLLSFYRSHSAFESKQLRKLTDGSDSFLSPEEEEIEDKSPSSFWVPAG